MTLCLGSPPTFCLVQRCLHRGVDVAPEPAQLAQHPLVRATSRETHGHRFNESHRGVGESNPVGKVALGEGFTCRIRIAAGSALS